jgi:hypothetical protein
VSPPTAEEPFDRIWLRLSLVGRWRRPVEADQKAVASAGAPGDTDPVASSEFGRGVEMTSRMFTLDGVAEILQHFAFDVWL